MQLLPKLISEICGLLIKLSKTFTFIFRFSRMNSVLYVLFAKIPPTLAAQLIIKSGLNFSIRSFVSLSENKSASTLFAENTSQESKFLKCFVTDDPTKPDPPKTRILSFLTTTNQ